MTIFQEKYKKEVLPQLQKQFEIKNYFQIPSLVKVIINCGVGKNAKDKNYLDNVVNTLTKISGQKPVFTKAKKSIAAFKVREGSIVGVVVTLRGKRMFDFLDKLINITFPSVRDFRGVSKKIVDKTGNLTVGFKEHVAFPEIGNDEIDRLHGLEICIHTSAKTKERGLALFTLLGFPFKNE